MTKNKTFKKERKQKIENKILKEVKEVVPSYNPKYYAHFDRPISFRNITQKLISRDSKSLKLTDESKIKIFKKINKLKRKLNDETEIAKHPFYPFIGFDIDERRVSIKRKIKYYESILPTLTGKSKKKCLANLKKLKENNIVKSRPIRYSSHFDGCIYAFYSKKIYEDYEKKIKEYGINDEILAYRTIIRHLHDLASLEKLLTKDDFKKCIEQACANDKGRGGSDRDINLIEFAQKTLEKLKADPLYEAEYKDFVGALSYAKGDEVIDFPMV